MCDSMTVATVTQLSPHSIQFHSLSLVWYSATPWFCTETKPDSSYPPFFLHSLRILMYFVTILCVCARAVVSAKPQSPKLPNRHSRLSSFVEVTADGLTSETKKTGKRSGHLELQWNEDLTLWDHWQTHKFKFIWLSGLSATWLYVCDLYCVSACFPVMWRLRVD